MEPIEVRVMNYLKENLDVPVFPNEPDLTKYQSFVVFEKTGSSDENQLNSCTMVVQSYGKTLYDAITLNSQVINVMKRMHERNDISRSKCETDYNFTDQNKKIHRYQAVFDLGFYE